MAVLPQTPLSVCIPFQTHTHTHTHPLTHTHTHIHTHTLTQLLTRFHFSISCFSEPNITVSYSLVFKF